MIVDSNHETSPCNFSSLNCIKKAAITIIRYPIIAVPWLILSVFESSKEIAYLEFIDVYATYFVGTPIYGLVLFLLITLVNAATIAMYRDICLNKALSFIFSFNDATDKLVQLVGAAILAGLATAISSALILFTVVGWAAKSFGTTFFEDFNILTPSAIIVVLIVAILLTTIQTYFAYIFQTVMLEDRYPVDSIKRSIGISFNYFINTFFILFLFVLIGSPSYVIEYSNGNIFTSTVSGILIKNAILELGECWALIAITEAFMKITNFQSSSSQEEWE